jgi:acetyl esterase/lipase
MTEPPPPLHLPARDIPIPSSVSPEAQAVLAMPPMEQVEYPALDDIDGWRAMIAAYDKTVAALLAERARSAPVTTEALDLGDFGVHVITPVGLADDDRRVYLDIHGGAFIYGRGDSCRAMGISSASRVDARVWAVDYRMPPDHPFPAALDDCLLTYRTVLEEYRPEDIIVGGASAGGNLAVALVLRARDERFPLPAAVVLLTPGSDLTESGDSLQTNLGLDPLLGGSGKPAFLLHAAGHDLKDPYISPLFGDFTRGSRPPSSPRAPATCCSGHGAPAPGAASCRCRCGAPRHRRCRARWILRHGARRRGDQARDPPLRRHARWETNQAGSK